MGIINAASALCGVRLAAASMALSSHAACALSALEGRILALGRTLCPSSISLSQRAFLRGAGLRCSGPLDAGNSVRRAGKIAAAGCALLICLSACAAARFWRLPSASHSAYWTSWFRLPQEQRKATWRAAVTKATWEAQQKKRKGGKAAPPIRHLTQPAASAHLFTRSAVCARWIVTCATGGRERRTEDDDDSASPGGKATAPKTVRVDILRPQRLRNAKRVGGTKPQTRLRSVHAVLRAWLPAYYAAYYSTFTDSRYRPSPFMPAPL